MKVDKETLRKIAHLARLELKEEDEPAMLDSLSEILTWVEKLNEVDTNHIQPLMNMSQEVNNFREDIEITSLDHERGLKNAPKKDQNYFRVPKVLE